MISVSPENSVDIEAPRESVEAYETIYASCLFQLNNLLERPIQNEKRIAALRKEITELLAKIQRLYGQPNGPENSVIYQRYDLYQ